MFFNKGCVFNRKRKKLRTKHATTVPPTASSIENNSDSSDDADDSDDSDFEESDSDKMTTLHEECNMQLRAEKLHIHLASSFCNNKSPSMVKTIMMRYVKLLIWMSVAFENASNSTFNVGCVLSTFIVEKSKLLPVYYQHLRDRVLLKPSTIIDLNENVQLLVHWFCVYRTELLYATDSSLLYNVNLVIKAMRKVFNKQRKIEDSKSKDNSIEGLIRARKWPVGGLQELHQAVKDQMAWARALCASVYVPSLSTFNLFMQLFMAAIFACSIQGRVGSFDSLEFGQKNDLLLNGFAMSACFKTGLQFGLQPCIFSPLAMELLIIYFNFMRPKLKEEPSDPLFITFNGTSLRVGRFVTAFFKRTLDGLRITTTTIRCMVETESSELLLRGEINDEARDSVLSVNGHSSITSKKFYQKRSRTQDIALVEQVHKRLVHVSSPSSTDVESESPIVFVEPVSTISSPSSVVSVSPVTNVGLLHPCFDITGRRVTWSAVEVKIVGEWCTEHQQQHPESVNVVSNCLRYILNDPSVRQHFHPHHVVDSTRLRWGWEKYQNDIM